MDFQDWEIFSKILSVNFLNNVRYDGTHCETKFKHFFKIIGLKSLKRKTKDLDTLFRTTMMY